MGELKKEVIEYLDEFTFVNPSEVVQALNDYVLELQGEDLSFNDLMDCSQGADYYIQLRNLHFDPDLVCTINKKNRQLHLQDLNQQFTDEQVAKKEKQRNVAFQNACDCMYYGYGRSAWNSNGLDDEERTRVRTAAFQLMAEDL